jgi:hypothetical protein
LSENLHHAMDPIQPAMLILSILSHRELPVNSREKTELRIQTADQPSRAMPHLGD